MGQAIIPLLISTIISAGISIYMTSQIGDQDQDDAGTAINKSGTNASRNPVYGTCRTGAVPVYNNVDNAANEYLLNVFACGIGVSNIQQLYIDDVEVLGTMYPMRETPSGGYNQLRFSDDSLINNFDKQVEVQLRAGLDTGIPMQLAIEHGDGEWTSAMRGDRVCAVAIKTKRIIDDEGVRIMSDTFKVGMLVDGLPLYDPRYMSVGQKAFYNELANVPSNHRQTGRNPALAILDYMTDDYYGMGISLEFFDLESFKSSATWCDENKFHIDGQIDNSQEFSTNLDRMLKCANLSLFTENGNIVLRYEDVALPVRDFNEDNIINGTFEVTEQNSSDYANVIEIEYKNTELDEEQDIFTAPENVNSDAQIKKDGFIESVSMSMPLTRYAGNSRNDEHSPMKKLANRELNRRQFQKQIKFDIDLYEDPVNIFDVVTVTDESLAWDEKEFRVTAINKSLTDERFHIASISLTEYADEIYTGTKNGSGGSSKPSKPNVTSPTNLNFNIEDYTTRGYGTLSWQRTWFETEAEFIVDIKRDSESSWTRLGRTKDTSWKVSRLYPDVYDFRIATHSNLYGSSNFTVLEDVVISSIGNLPEVTGATANFDGLDCEFSWDDMLEAEVTGDFEDSKLVREVFSHYRVSLYDTTSGESFIDTFTTSSNKFVWTYEQNVSKGITRSLRVKVDIVAIDGTMSQIDAGSVATGVNAQVAAIADTNNYGRLGAIWFNYTPSEESDWEGTDVHISETPNFTPTSNTLVKRLGKQASWVWYFPEGTPDQAVRYVKLGHFDTFGKTGINYSVEEAVYNSHIDNDATPFDDSELQAELAAHDARMNGHDTTLAAHDSRMNGHDTTLAAHDSRMNDHDTTLAAHDSRMNDHDTTLAAHDSRMDGHDTTLTAHDSRMDGLQTELDAAEQVFSEQIPDISSELVHLRNAANAPTTASGTPIDTRINMVASPNLDETAAWGLFADNSGKSQFIIAADEFIVSGGKQSGNAANDDVAFYYANGNLLINNATINDLTAQNIKAGTITATELATNTITSNEIKAGTITASDIASNTITSNEIKAGTITASDIASNTITAAQINANAITASELAADAVTATHIVAGTITSDEIAASTITASEIAANAITASELAAQSVSADHIVAGTITATELGADSVTTNALAAGAVTADQVSANAIETNHLAAGAVTATKIAAGAVTAETIEADAISGDHIKADSYILVGQDSESVILNGDHTSDWKLAVGNSSMIHAPFRVNKAGKLYASDAEISGNINGSNITGSTISGTTITGASIQASYIATDVPLLAMSYYNQERYGSMSIATIEAQGNVPYRGYQTGISVNRSGAPARLNVASYDYSNTSHFTRYVNKQITPTITFRTTYVSGTTTRTGYAPSNPTGSASLTLYFGGRSFNRTVSGNTSFYVSGSGWQAHVNVSPYIVSSNYQSSTGGSIPVTTTVYKKELYYSISIQFTYLTYNGSKSYLDFTMKERNPSNGVYYTKSCTVRDTPNNTANGTSGTG